MKIIIIPLVLGIIGTVAGAGAGFMLRPAATDVVAQVHDCPEPEKDVEAEILQAASEYVKLSNQFVVPVIEGGRVVAMVVLSLSAEIAAGKDALVYEHEPKLRDALNDVLFVHANTGGFGGVFTEPVKMSRLRLGLSEAAQEVLGQNVRGILVDSVMRQEG